MILKEFGLSPLQQGHTRTRWTSVSPL